MRHSAFIVVGIATALTGAVLAQPAPSGIRRNTSATTSVGDFHARADAGAPPPVDINADTAPVRVGGTGTVAADHGPTGSYRSDNAAPTVDMTTPIGPSDVARLFHTHEALLRSCYTTALATHPALAGRVVVQFVVGRDGQLSRTAATGLPEAPEVAMCMVNQLAQVRFPPPATGTLPFQYPLTFSPPPQPDRSRRGRRPPVRPTAPPPH